MTLVTGTFFYHQYFSFLTLLMFNSVDFSLPPKPSALPPHFAPLHRKSCHRPCSSVDSLNVPGKVGRTVADPEFTDRGPRTRSSTVASPPLQKKKSIFDLVMATLGEFWALFLQFSYLV